jgi:hypothetical protein
MDVFIVITNIHLGSPGLNGSDGKRGEPGMAGATVR